MSNFPWRTLLVASVALNLLVIGVAAGAYGAGVRVEREASGAIVDRMPGPRAFMAALPAPTRAKVRAELANSWTETREARRAAQQARRDAFEAAAMEPYDVARVKAAFARLRAADQQSIGVFQDNIVEAFARLTPQERREAIAALRRAPPASRATMQQGEEQGANDQQSTRRERLRERVRERRELRRQRREDQRP